MSLFGSPPAHDSGEEPSRTSTPRQQPQKGGGSTRGGLFDDPPSASANGLFDGGSSGTSRGDDAASPSLWDLPTSRKPHRRLDMIRSLLPADIVPVSYVDAFDTILREDGGSGGRVTAGGVAKLFATARLEAETQARIMTLITASGESDDVALTQNEFHVLLALIGLAQEGEVISLDGVDERRGNLPEPKLAGLTAEPVLAPVAELVAAKPPQTPNDARWQAQTHAGPETGTQPSLLRPSMDDPEDDPWNSPEIHKGHAHLNTDELHGPHAAGRRRDDPDKFLASTASRTLGGFAADSTAADTSKPAKLGSSTAGEGSVWGLLGEASPAAASGATGFREAGGADPTPASHPFGGDGGVDHSLVAAAASTARGFPSGRTGHSVEGNIIVSLIPEKEGLFMFQHHNYEITSHRRGSKVVRRYSDFVWLLDCLHKRYPFRALPLLPPKRVALNGNHLSNDGAFIEKRRRGLTRFLNALARHPVLSQEQLVIMFLTVPTELNVWRKQAIISVQDELAERALPPGLEDSLPSGLEDLFSRTRASVSRSAELYITVCNVMDRLVKRSEGVAADHARIAVSLTSLTESSADAYATDTNEIALLNDGLVAMSKHLRACQTLMEDESRVWDEGVLEDLKQQRDALVSVRQMFERRERMDHDGIPHLERRIQTNETRLASLRSKPEGMVKPGEIERVAESIIKDKEAIVRQHNRSIFIKECLRDELVTFQRTQYHISRWNQDWAGERVKYAEMLADNWRRLLDELEGMPLGD